MQIKIRALALLFILCLLAVQAGGMHLHIDAINQSADFHGIHLHQTETGSHDHGSDTDVSLTDQLPAGWIKLIALIFLCTIFIVPPKTLPGRHWLKTHQRQPPSCHYGNR